MQPDIEKWKTDRQINQEGYSTSAGTLTAVTFATNVVDVQLMYEAYSASAVMCH